MLNTTTALIRKARALLTTSPVAPEQPGDKQDERRELAEQLLKHESQLQTQRDLIKRLIRAIEAECVVFQHDDSKEAYEDACASVRMVPKTHYQRTLGDA